MGYLQDYRTRVNAYASSPVDSMTKTYEKFINDAFQNSPAYRTGTLNGNPIEFQLVSGKNSKDMYREKEFLFRPNTSIERGDIIILNSESWLVVDTNYTNNISPKASVILCNEDLKWNDAVGNTISYPCATIQYRSIRTISEDKQDINLPQGHMFCLAPMNTDTNSIRYKQRFLFCNQPYEITGIDCSTTTYNGKGVIYFSVSVVPEKDTDDHVNEVADNTEQQGTNIGGWTL
jgi:hypothetical protein